MFEPASVIVGLEIGTSKVCAVVGEMNAAGALNIVGVGQARSRGVRKGEIADASVVADDIRNAIVEAEQMADVEIRSVYLGVTGAHIRGFINRGVHPVVSADREITNEDVEDVVRNARAINVPEGNYVFHTNRQHYLVDGQDGIVDPIGMLGARVEVDMHVVHVVLHDLPVGGNDRMHAAIGEAADVPAGDAEIDAADFRVGHLLGLDDGVAHVLLGLRGIDDLALADAAGPRLADADDVEGASGVHFADDRAHFGGADFEANDDRR